MVDAEGGCGRRKERKERKGRRERRAGVVSGAGWGFSLGNFGRLRSSHSHMKSSIVALGLSWLVAAPWLWGQGSGPAMSGEVVELPKFVVTDTRELPPPEDWRYATIPGFEILTNASDKATQRLLRDFDMFRQALSYVWPVPDRVAQSTALIICGRRGKFDGFVPAGKSSAESTTASLFLRQGSRAAIIIDLQATTLNILNVDGSNDAATGTDSGLISVEHDKQLYREYVRYLMSQSQPRSPAWLEEGLSQIIMKMSFEKRYIEFAKLEDPNTVSAQAAMVSEMNAASAAAGGGEGETFALPGAPAEDRDFAAALRRRRLVDLDKFFAVAHDSSEAMNPLGNNRWAKQAYAFVHMCLYGFKGKYQKAFTTFLARSSREPVTEALFKECFKMTYKQMLMEIRGYCDFTVYEARILQSKKGGPDLIVTPAPLALREATQSEVGRIKGEALAIGGHGKAARAELIAPYQRGERDPNLLAALGLYEKSSGEEVRARKFLEAAFGGKSKRADACVELARLRYADVLAAAAAGDGRLTAGQLASVLEPLRQGRGVPPLFALYDTAAEALARSGPKIQRDDAMLVVEGAQLFPTRLKLVYQGAVLANEVGELKAAHALADHGIKYGPDAKAKERFQGIKASFSPAPPEAPERLAPVDIAPAGRNPGARK